MESISAEDLSQCIPKDSKFLKQLGVGQYGFVVLCTSGRQSFAIKLSKVSETSLNEECMLKMLKNHPNIVPFYDAWRSQNIHVLQMGYIPGRTLLDVLRSESITEDRCRIIFLQLVSAIRHAHEQCSIVHRDLKDENIMIREDGITPVIIDWGMAARWSPSRTFNQDCGSPHYAAPEIFHRQRYYGPEVDTWSLGVILYTMTTSLFPFAGENPMEIAYQVTKGKYQVPHCSASLQDLIARLLTGDVRTRITLREVSIHPWCQAGGNKAGAHYMSIQPLVLPLVVDDPPDEGPSTIRASPRSESVFKRPIPISEGSGQSPSPTMGDGHLKREISTPLFRRPTMMIPQSTQGMGNMIRQPAIYERSRQTPSCSSDAIPRPFSCHSKEGPGTDLAEPKQESRPTSRKPSTLKTSRMRKRPQDTAAPASSSSSDPVLPVCKSPLSLSGPTPEKSSYVRSTPGMTSSSCEVPAPKSLTVPRYHSETSRPSRARPERSAISGPITLGSSGMTKRHTPRRIQQPVGERKIIRRRSVADDIRSGNPPFQERVIRIPLLDDDSDSSSS